jgi:hypothetical protein
MKPEMSLSYVQYPANGLYFEQDKLNTKPQNSTSKIHINIKSFSILT